MGFCCNFVVLMEAQQVNLHFRMNWENTRPTHLISSYLALFQGFLFSFGSQVGRNSRPTLEGLIRSHLLSTLPQSSLSKKDKEVLCRQLFFQPLPLPPTQDSDSGFVCVEGYWVPQGPLAKSHENDDVVLNTYVLTDTVRSNLRDLARVVSAA